jgi:hypothetical protein
MIRKKYIYTADLPHPWVAQSSDSTSLGLKISRKNAFILSSVNVFCVIF